MKKCILIPIVSLGLLLSFCKKKETSPEVNEEPPISQPTPTKETKYKSNVVFIDTNKLVLNTDTSLTNSGIYKFAYSGDYPGLKVGDVIFSNKGGGYIRKIASITQTINPIILQTTQGKMEDVFESARITYESDMSNMYQKGVVNSGINYQFNNVDIYQNGPLSIKLTSGYVTLNPKWKFDYDFELGSLKYLEFSNENSTIDAEFTFSISASQATSLLNKTTEIVHFKKFIQSGPVATEVDFDLSLKVSATIDAAISRSVLLKNNSSYGIGYKYTNSQWQGIYSLNPVTTITLNSTSGNAGIVVNVELIPKISAKVYGVAGPYASVALVEELNGKVASPSLNWNFDASAWVRTTVGIKAEIFGYGLPDYNNSWETTKIEYKTPFEITKISGDNQSGNPGQVLSSPLRVRILDSKGNSQTNVPVYFNVSGLGSVSTGSILSDNNGYASTNWTLGNGSGTVNVTAKDGSNNLISGSPIKFTAITGTVQPLDFSTNLTPDTLATPMPTGIIQINATGGVLPYSYSIGGAYQSVSNTYTALTGGNTYTVNVKDATNTIKTKVVVMTGI